VRRRDFLRLLALAAASGASLRPQQSDAQAADELYGVPKSGNVHLLHFTDSHAQLLPLHFREPSVNLGAGEAAGRPPHLVGGALLERFNIAPRSALAHAFTHLDFADAAHRYGKVGGFAHLATLVKRLRADRPGAVLLDGGDSWQGSATSLWTKGADMIGAQKRLGVEFTTGHWEFTYGAQRVRQAVERELAPVEFLAQNVRNADFEELVFKPYALRTVNGVPLAVIGQAFPYTPIANPRHFVAEWTFGIRESALQKTVDETRARGAQVVVLLSHNGMDVDLKLARRVRGIDVILGGHTHDGVPEPTVVGETLVTNAGSHGKFLAVLDLDASGGKVRGWRYKLLPVFANLLPADAQMQAYIDEVRAPYSAKLSERLAITEGLLYRRGNFNGTFDQLILDALMAVKGTEIAFSPGFRWGGTLLPGDAIRFEHVMDQTAITYPAVTVNDFTGARIKEILEDVCDNLFHLDPYLQQGGDMVRVGGMTYTCDPRAAMGARISDLRLNGAPMQADKAYKVAGWASVAEDVAGEPVWDVVARYLRERRTIAPLKLNLPRLVHVEGDPGIA
jgi:sulfur-oxidizing protein SoxB